MPAALFLSSGNLIADRRYDFGRDLQLRGDLAAAADLMAQAVELEPGFASAWFALEICASSWASVTMPSPHSRARGSATRRIAMAPRCG
jgi:hypothetical protein